MCACLRGKRLSIGESDVIGRCRTAVTRGYMVSRNHETGSGVARVRYRGTLTTTASAG